ncbi:hypothetical protein KVV02_005187, partial [Mortierella alpina]
SWSALARSRHSYRSIRLTAGLRGDKEDGLRNATVLQPITASMTPRPGGTPYRKIIHITPVLLLCPNRFFLFLLCPTLFPPALIATHLHHLFFPSFCFWAPFLSLLSFPSHSNTHAPCRFSISHALAFAHSSATHFSLLRLQTMGLIDEFRSGNFSLYGQWQVLYSQGVHRYTIQSHLLNGVTWWTCSVWPIPRSNAPSFEQNSCDFQRLCTQPPSLQTRPTVYSGWALDTIDIGVTVTSTVEVYAFLQAELTLSLSLFLGF